jgi:hypothetical protein
MCYKKERRETHSKTKKLFKGNKTIKNRTTSSLRKNRQEIKWFVHKKKQPIYPTPRESNFISIHSPQELIEYHPT